MMGNTLRKKARKALQKRRSHSANVETMEEDDTVGTDATERSPGLNQRMTMGGEDTMGANESCPDLQKDLIAFYRQEHSNISVSPLVEEYVVPLVEFYVKPPLEAVDLQHPFGNHTKTSVLNYEQLFCQETGKLHKNIYVTSKAGMGKTSFCKHICMTWCQAHNPVNSLNTKFKPEDIRALKGFEILFYVTLRDMDRSLCHLDDFIQDFVTDNVSTSPNQPMHQILDERPCLILIDGLDEWIHPQECKKHRNDHDIPHRKYRKNWTILTTTRSWKFDIIRLSSNQIDSHIELNELDEGSSQELVKHAINVLNMKYKSSKTAEEFYRTTSQLKLGKIRTVPYLHLHCVCLWYDGGNIGNSKCEIYTNILELTLNRGTQKLQLESYPAPLQQDKSTTIPKCMEDKEYCALYWSLLMKIGELAFHSLFGSGNRQILVMDYAFATNFLKPDELQTCLKLGLLSQNKVYGPVSRRIRNVSFQHKTVHEYLAAFYMQSSLRNQSSHSQNIHRLVVQTCSTLSHILEMSEVFIFLSGFNSAAYSYISLKLINTVNEDHNIQHYRSHLDFRVKSPEYGVMFNYQTLLVNCVDEMQLNTQDFHPLPLEDVMINEQSKQTQYMSHLQKLIQGNSGGIKSLCVKQSKSTEELTYILNRLNLQHFHSLKKLHLMAVVRQSDVERLLDNSANTLHSLALQNARFIHGTHQCESRTELSLARFDTIISMSLLTGLCLGGDIVTHEQLENLSTFLTSRVTMTQIYLRYIKCSDHQESCPGVQFNLSKHETLQLLGLLNMPVSQLEVNTQHLEECLMGLLRSSVITSWLKSLQGVHTLHRLHCNFGSGYTNIPFLITTISSLSQLEILHIMKTDLTDNRLVFTTDMTRLQNIELREVSMTSSDLQALADTLRLLTQSITVLMWDCTVVERDIDYQTVKEDIRKSHDFAMIFDGIDKDGRNVFQFRTVK